MTHTISALKQRDCAAWAGVFEAFADRVYQYAYYRLNADRSEAQDVVQEVFLRAIKNIHSFDGPENGFLPWLRGIARHVLARCFSEKKRCVCYPSQGCPSDSPAANSTMPFIREVADDQPAAPAILISREDILRVGVALATLPPEWERVLRLKYYDGKSVADIAATVEASSKAVESLLHRAREGFRAAWKDVMEEES